MNHRWRTLDIVVAAVIAVAFGVIFWAWGLVWRATDPLFAFFPPSQALIYGVWLVPAVLGGLVIRKPGAALYCETLAATVSALLGSRVGRHDHRPGPGAGPRRRARLRRVPVPLVPAADRGAGRGADRSERGAVRLLRLEHRVRALAAYRIPYALFTIVSATVIAGVGGWYLTRALAGTGALDRFPAGRERRTV